MNIFYDNVDANLQAELNMRGKAGFHDRTNKSMNFMLGKIANVQCTAYEGTGSASAQIPEAEFGILGGATTRTDRYLPSGPNGFLTTRNLERSEVDFYKSETDPDYKIADFEKKNPQLGEAYEKKLDPFRDSSKRVGPYLTSIDVTIGDHSMGLLNKATVSFMVPNAERDLDAIENTWFYPGRFVKLDIVHPNSAIVSADVTYGLLDSGSVPSLEKLNKLYPGIDATTLQTEIRRMNVFTFEGLITSFDFSYTTDAGIEATIQLTGTSNVFADISMYFPDSAADKAAEVAAKEAAAKIDSNPALGANVSLVTQFPASDINGKDIIITIPKATAPAVNAFYAALSKQFDAIVNSYKQLNFITTPIGEINVLTKFYSSGIVNNATDQYILAGKLYDETTTIDAANNFDSGLVFGIQPPPATTSLLENPKGTYERYITLGALIQFINNEIFDKYLITPNQKEPVRIIHTDKDQFSNYYERLTSCIPHKILFLPADPSKSNGMNWHGDLGYYRNSVVYKTNLERSETPPWPGVHETLSDDTQIMYPSRIFINLTRISELTVLLSQKNVKTFTISSFLSAISNDILYASAGAISLKLVSDKNKLSQLIFADTAYLKSSDLDDKTKKPVLPYSVPMFSNHENGSVVRDFKFNATLPSSAKNLSYVLNSGDKVTNDQIAPYMNFMYNSKNPAAINEAIKLYKARHMEILSELALAKIINGQWPFNYGMKDSSCVSGLYKALSDYIKIPTDDIQKSQQITAPIFPFTAEFTIDGINGLRYGDVLTFDALPKKYRANTVFSVISVTHTVSNTGEWTTAVKCIMRPSIS
jgi:hypothetical protein